MSLPAARRSVLLAWEQRQDGLGVSCERLKQHGRTKDEQGKPGHRPRRPSRPPRESAEPGELGLLAGKEIEELGPMIHAGPQLIPTPPVSAHGCFTVARWY